MKPGSLIAGKYKIIDEIGHGGMGVVYKAEDLKLKRCVALKFLPPHLMDSSELKERFLIEAQAAAALSHPNICVIYEVGEDEDRSFIAMEYIEGGTLRDKIKKGPLKPEQALDFAIQIAAGLGEAHRKGIIHRDIKSANIMVTERGQAKVMDFGLAKLRGGSSLTRSQTTLGTVAYMSPEQARGDELDQRTDIWSLGVVLYEMLAGRLPFRGDHDQAVIYSILHNEPESLIKVIPGMAPELEQVVGQAMAKKLAERYQTMEEFREDLAALAEGLKPLKAKARLAKKQPDLPEKSIAILPFINDSPDQENTYFINGVMEEILGNLQKIKDLRVISRTSVEQYRERKKSVREIAEELGVNYIVEGSGQKYGTAFRLRAQLIMAAKETHLWGQSFQQKITDVEDIFNIQTQIAESIAAELKAVIAPEEKQLIEKIPTADLTAYDAFLKGKFAAYKTAPEDLDAAIQYFEEAKERDPGFALPYTGIAMVWMIRQQWGYATPDEAGPKIMEAVGRALELDSTLAEVQYMLANMKVYGMWDWESGESAYKKTLEINPNHAEAHGMYSMLLIILGRPEEGMEHIELALKLDPHNPMINLWYSADLLFVHRYDDCISVGRDVLEKNPSIFGVLDQVKDALHLTGRYEEAFEAAKLYYSKVYKDFDHVFDQYERLGYAGMLNLEADSLMEQSKLKYVCPNDIATLYIHAGNRERALDCLEQAYESRDSNIIFTGVRSVFANLRDEPRFQELLRKLKLPAANRG
jgi:serine/threonine protein kinase